MDSDLSLFEFAAEDDSLLQQPLNPNAIETHSIHHHTPTSPVFICSPLQIPTSNPISTDGIEEDTSRSSLCSDSTVNKENKEEGMEPKQIKRKGKGSGYNLRKSLAWDSAFFTEEGVLNPVELSLLTIREEDTSSASGAASSNLKDIDENLFTELPATASGKYRKNGGSSLVPKNNSPVRKNGAPSSVAKRKVVSAHDVVRSSSKRTDCPGPVASSSLKRPASLITTKTSAKDSKVSKLPAPKINPRASIKTSKISTLGASESKRNQTTLPVVNIQKPSVLKGSSSNTKSRSALNSPKVGPAGKSITTKTSLGQAKRNVASSVKGSINLQHPLKIEVNNALDVSFHTSLPPAVLVSNSHTRGPRTANTLPKNTYHTGLNKQPTQLPTAPKPSGLRKPSPSLGFFVQQSKLSPMQSPLKMTSPPCNPPESNISNLRKSGSSANPVSELRPPLASRSSLEKVRDCSLERNVKPSFSSSESPVLVSSNPTLHGVESNSQVTNRQMENIVQCNDASYKVTNPTLHGVESNSQELDGFVGVDELCPGQAGPPTTAIKISIEDAELQTNEGNLLLKETSQMGKCEIDAKVIDSSQESSELEISQLKTRSSSAIEVTGPSLKSDISDHQLVEERPFDLSLKDHGIILQANPVCKANETFGEQTETMHSGPFFSDDQMLQDNAADNSSHVEDYDVAVTENSHAYPHFGSIELEKEDHDVSPELKSQKGDINEPYGKQTEMMNALNYIATPIVSDSQMLQDNAADITSKVQGYNAAGIENFPAFSHIGFEEQEKELVKPVAEEAEPYPISSEMSWDNPANISSKVQDYNRAELEHGNEDFTAIGELRKQLKVEEGDMQSSNRTDRYNNISVSISANNDHKMVFDNVIEKQDGQIHLTREDTLQVDGSLLGEKTIFPEELKQENALHSDETEVTDVCQTELRSPRTSSMQDSMLDCESNAAASVQCHLLEDIIRMVANCDLNSHAQHEVEFHDQSTSVELGKMDEGVAGAVDAEDVNASCQKVGPFADSELENPYVTCETEVTDVCQTELRSPRTSMMPNSMLDCESNAAASIQCHLSEDRSSLLVEDIIPMVANCDLNSHAQHEVGFHDQSTSVELGNMDEGDRAGAVDAEDVNASCQKVGHFADSELENSYVTCEPSFAVQVESERWSKNEIKHVDVEVKTNLSVESSHCSFDSQPGDELCPCDDNSSSMIQMYMLEGENDDNAKGDQVEQITPYQCETKEICNDEEESTKAPTLSFDNSHSLEEPQILENESNTRVPLHTDMAQTFKESEGGNLVIEEQDDNCELQNPVNQIEEVSSTSVPQDEDTTEEHCSKESGINTKQDVLVIKPPFEAAGEEILTMKSDAVQNSPEEVSGHDS